MHKKCKDPNCEALELIKGYCLTHYRENFPAESVCLVDGCEKLVFRRGMCRNCYLKYLESTKQPEDVDTGYEAFEERKEVQELKAKLRRTYAVLRETKKQVEILDTVKHYKVDSKIIKREKSDTLREATAVALASDWHVYQTVKAAKVDYKNSYDVEVALKRSSKFFNGVLNLLEYHKHKFIIHDFILWLGGDFLNGFIHDEYLETNHGTPIKEILFAYEILKSGIDLILKESDIKKLYVPCSIGNHSRTTKKMRVSTSVDNNYEYLLYKMLSLAYEGNERVVFIVSESEHLHQQVYDFHVRYTHGHRVRYSNGLAGIFAPIRKICKGWDTIQPCEIVNVGHFHQSHLDSYGITVNASLVGYDEFAMSCGFDYAVPSQTFYLIDSKRGKCQTTRIWVD